MKQPKEVTFLDFKINLPSLKEQNKIGEFLNQLDRLIELEKEKNMLKNNKKGFLQKMFV